ncbi:AAA family ATPase [Symbiobacterium terraclitae]|uniref:AAA family ATPase n=1 Tax=Symbiobacterium terraclitae TaxID=557451 RepID=UPI0035B540FF
MTLIPRLLRPRPASLRTPVPKVITFWSPVSAGSTTLAAALAAALARHGSRVALLDYDLWTPSLPRVTSSLDAAASHVLHGTLDPARFAAALQRVNPPGVHLLAGADDPLRAEALSREHYQQLIAATAALHDAVIIDAGRMLSLAASLTAVDAADLLVVPVLPHPNAARHVARYLNLLESELRVDLAHMRLILNHVSPHPQLDRATITGILRHRIDLEVPHRREWGLGPGLEWPAPLSPDHVAALLHPPTQLTVPEAAHASD